MFCLACALRAIDMHSVYVCRRLIQELQVPTLRILHTRITIALVHSGLPKRTTHDSCSIYKDERGRVPTLRSEVEPQSRFVNGSTVPAAIRLCRTLATGKSGSANIPVEGNPPSCAIEAIPRLRSGSTVVIAQIVAVPRLRSG